MGWNCQNIVPVLSCQSFVLCLFISIDIFPTPLFFSPLLDLCVKLNYMFYKTRSKCLCGAMRMGDKWSELLFLWLLITLSTDDKLFFSQKRWKESSRIRLCENSEACPYLTRSCWLLLELCLVSLAQVQLLSLKNQVFSPCVSFFYFIE